MNRLQISKDGFFFRSTKIEFDDENLYITDKNGEAEIPLEKITLLRKTSNAIGNIYFWRIEYVLGEDPGEVQFRPNSSLWNTNFKEFVTKMLALNPDHVKSKRDCYQFE